MKIHLEYVWIDAFNNLRSKIRIIEINSRDIKVKNIPEWSFDGSSTGQAMGHDSDILLIPVVLYKNPFVDYMDSRLVLCECMDKNRTVLPSNHRAQCWDDYILYKDHECLFGIEQEYVIFERKNDYGEDDINKNLPYMWKEHNEPELGGQGPYYCAVGGDRAFGREISNKHLQLCLKMGLSICGTNAEVMASQWEFQIGTCDAITVCDDLWIARYVLNRISEEYNCWISYDPKPYKGSWNGSGAHCNMSTKEMRDPNGLDKILEACDKLKNNHEEHMKVYGEKNEERLCGLYETSNMDQFTVGAGNRGCSIRIPHHVINNKCGYFEDRRPAANIDPYLVVSKLMKTVCE